MSEWMMDEENMQSRADLGCSYIVVDVDALPPYLNVFAPDDEI